MGFSFELFDNRTLFTIENVICKNILNLDINNLRKILVKYKKSNYKSV